MKLEELLSTLESPNVIRPTRRMTQGELEGCLDKAADILRGNADHSEFRGYVFALLFYKRISDCFDEEVRTQAATLTKAGVPHLLEANRLERFWMHLRQFESAADSLHGRMRNAWTHVPAWAKRGYGAML